MNKLLPAVFAVTFLSACNSPVLNHANAQGSTSDQQTATQQNGSCPLAFPRHGMCGELVWDQAPNSQDPSFFVLRFWKMNEATSSGPYSNPGLDVFVKLWMPSMGHGSSPVTLVQARDNGGQAISGVFQGSNAYFIMPGSWEVRVQLRTGAQVDEEAVENVEI